MRILWTILINIICIIVTYYVAVLLHEYGHAAMAWHFSYKASPFDISYGSWLLIPVSEAVDYQKILASGHGSQEALIGISGISVTIILFCISMFSLNQKLIQKTPLFLGLAFWLADMNVMEMFSYLNRTFIMGDLGELIQGSNISPLWVFIPGCLIVGFSLYCFFQFMFYKWFTLSNIKSIYTKRIFLWLTFWPLLFSVIYSEAPTDWKLLSYSVNIFSVIVVCYILKSCDPGASQHILKKANCSN
jgi:hypothetical protein